MNHIKLYQDNMEIPLDLGVFSGGEVRVRIIGDLYPNSDVRIEALLFNSNDMMSLIMLVDAIRNIICNPIHLTMPYVPYARQDRRCNSGESFSLKVFAGIINSLNFSSVIVYDPHSAVTTNCLDRVIVVPTQDLILRHVELYGWITRTIWSGVPLYLVCPDKGAIEKCEAIANIFSFANIFSLKGIIYAEKVRNPENGQIVSTTVHNVPDDIKRANLLICDDIIDGGMTYCELAKVLKSYEPLAMNLYATHGIFSRGKEVLLNKKTEPFSEVSTYHVDHTGEFDNVWCTIDFTKYK